MPARRIPHLPVVEPSVVDGRLQRQRLIRLARPLPEMAPSRLRSSAVKRICERDGAAMPFAVHGAVERDPDAPRRVGPLIPVRIEIGEPNRIGLTRARPRSRKTRRPCVAARSADCDTERYRDAASPPGP